MSRRRDHRRRSRRPRRRDRRALRLADRRRPGVLHGNRTYLLQDDDGQILEAHSISAGLDYPGIGPEHSWLHEIGRVEYVSVTDTKRWKPSSSARASKASSRRSSRPRARPCARNRARPAEGPSAGHEHVRPRRQGRIHRRRRAGGGTVSGATTGRIEARFAALAAKAAPPSSRSSLPAIPTVEARWQC